MEATTSEPQVSQATTYVLYTAGVSAGLLVLYIVYGVLSCIARIASRAKQMESASKSKVKAAKTFSEPKETRALQSREAKERGMDLKALIEEEKKARKKSVPKEDTAAAHELWLNTLKGHADAVHGIAWSKDGKHIATACEDMYVRVFDLSADVASKDPKFKRIKTAKIPQGVGFVQGADSVGVAMRGVADAQLALYSMSAKSGDGGVYQPEWLASEVHAREPCLTMTGVPAEAAIGGQGLLFSLSTKKELKVYTGQGRELATLEPNSLANHDLVVSQDARFVAVPSFTADLKIWEIKYNRERMFTGTSKVMDLKGHRSQIMTAAFSPDNKRAVTASKDLTLRVWNIDVRYTLSEDPKTLVLVPLPGGKVYQRMAFGPHGIIAATHEGTVHFLAASSGELLERIDAHDAALSMMRWSPVPVALPGGGSGYVLATCSRDKRVRLWRSPPLQ